MHVDSSTLRGVSVVGLRATRTTSVADLWKRIIFGVLYPSRDGRFISEAMLRHSNGQMCTAPTQQRHIDILLMLSVVSQLFRKVAESLCCPISYGLSLLSGAFRKHPSSELERLYQCSLSSDT